MPGKVKFGLEKVHIAFLEQVQTEKIEVTDPPNSDGDIELEITADDILGEDSPETVTIPLSSTTHDTTEKVASAIVDVLNNNDVISSEFYARHEEETIYLVAKVADDNDDTLSISFTDADTTEADMGSSESVEDGTKGYGEPKAVPGAVNLSTSPEGDENTFYADNTKYYISTTNNGYTGDLEVAKIPNDILAEMVGMIVDNDGALVEDADGEQKEFALMGQFLEDEDEGRFVYYRCKAARPEQDNSTTDSGITPDTETATITMLPYEYEDKKIVKKTVEKSANEDVYDEFFDAVSMPNFS